MAIRYRTFLPSTILQVAFTADQVPKDADPQALETDTHLCPSLLRTFLVFDQCMTLEAWMGPSALTTLPDSPSRMGLTCLVTMFTSCTWGARRHRGVSSSYQGLPASRIGSSSSRQGCLLAAPV